jgi:signal transduction histidine kinase
MRKIFPPSFLRYLIPILSVLIVFSIQLLVLPIKEQGVFTLFLAAVMLNSWYSGLGPGLLATAMGTLAGLYFLTRPDYSSTNYLGTVIRLIEFLAISGLIIGLNNAYQSSTRLAEQARHEAEKATRAKDHFLAIVSHELRTPLTAIVGWVTLINKSNLEPGLIKQGLEAMTRNLSVLKTLIDDLLDISRITTGRLSLEIERTDVCEIIASVVNTMGPTVQVKQIDLTFHKENPKVMVNGDPARLQQVFFNLLANAVKFTPHKGEIEINVMKAGPEVQVSVKDSGDGISPSFLPYVFEPFQQGEMKSIERTGLGLGLSIVKELVELHGGKVEAHSDGAGLGSKFIIHLPISPVECPPQVHQFETATGS